MKSFLRKSIKRVALTVLGVLMISTLTSCGATTKTIKSEDMKITLSREYKESTLANATWYYTSPDGLAMGIRSLKDDVEKSGLECNSAQDYAAAYIKANNIPGSPKVTKKGDYVYFKYNHKVSGTDYSYLTCIYDHDDEYWLVNFACYKELYSEYEKDFFESADSVTFVEDDE
jgi:hypothetical protein